MDKEIIAKELLRVARELIAMEFSSEEALKKYLKKHPNAHRENHKVVTFHDNGNKKSEHNFVGDKQEGMSYGWHKNGKKDYEKEYKNGKPHGEHRSWYEVKGGIKNHGEFVDGKEHGTHRFWDAKGNLLSVKNWKDGKQHGLHRRFDSNGNIIEEGNFEDGKPFGKHLKKDYRGISELLNYEGGVLHGEQQYKTQTGSKYTKMYHKGKLVKTKGT